MTMMMMTTTMIMMMSLPRPAADCVRNIGAYAKLKDSLLELINHGTDPGLLDAQVNTPYA
jgi:hypothetical protein